MPWTDAASAIESAIKLAIESNANAESESDADSEAVRYAFAIIMKSAHSLHAQRARLSRTSRYPLFGAVLASLLLHLTLVFGWGWVRPWVPTLPAAGSQQSMQVVVSVRAPPAATSVPATVAHRQAIPKPIAETRIPPVQAMEKAATVADTTPSPAPLAPMANKAPDSNLAAATGATGTDTAKIRVAPTGEPVSADGLRQYRIELAGVARRFRHYPAMARSRGWEGVAEVVVSVNVGLPAPTVKLQRTSGHALLDEQAIEMLTRAVAVTPLPESLRNRNFSMPMPIRFSLEE